MSEYFSKINVPAYDSNKNGLNIELALHTIASDELKIKSKGSIAEALQLNFERTLEVMISIKKSWECLENYSYFIESKNNDFIVRDSKSSSMAIAIMLMNIYRKINKQPELKIFTGTGILRADGGFDSANLELVKKKNINECKMYSEFLTSSNCNHLFDLEEIMINTIRN